MYCSNLSTTVLEGERASDRAESSPLKIQSLDNERIIGRGGGGGGGLLGVVLKVLL